MVELAVRPAGIVVFVCWHRMAVVGMVVVGCWHRVAGVGMVDAGR